MAKRFPCDCGCGCDTLSPAQSTKEVGKMRKWYWVLMGGLMAAALAPWTITAVKACFGGCCGFCF